MRAESIRERAMRRKTMAVYRLNWANSWVWECSRSDCGPRLCGRTYGWEPNREDAVESAQHHWARHHKAKGAARSSPKKHASEVFPNPIERLAARVDRIFFGPVLDLSLDPPRWIRGDGDEP